MSVRVTNGKLAPCPASPNCVSTQSEDSAHFIEPFPLKSNVAEAKERIKQAVFSLPRTKLVVETENYLHFEFKSMIFRFVDDVEFYFDEKGGKIHFRSASRVGHSDLGVNRRRMEKIHRLLSERESSL